MNKRDYGRKVFRPLLVAFLELGFEKDYEDGDEQQVSALKKQLPIGELRVRIQVEAPSEGNFTAVYTLIRPRSERISELLQEKFNMVKTGKNNYYFEPEQFDHYFPIIMSYIDELHKVEL